MQDYRQKKRTENLITGKVKPNTVPLNGVKITVFNKKKILLELIKFKSFYQKSFHNKKSFHIIIFSRYVKVAYYHDEMLRIIYD